MEATGTNLRTLDLPSSTLAERQAHANLLLNLQAKKIAPTLDVPTLPHDIRDKLRSLGEPVRLFGENKANIRDRLRMCLARIHVEKEQAEKGEGAMGLDVDVDVDMEMEISQKKQGKSGVQSQSQSLVQYSHASQELQTARVKIAQYSLRRAQDRLSRERKRRWGGKHRQRLKRNLGDGNGNGTATPNIVGEDDDDDEYGDGDGKIVMKELDELDDSCQKQYDAIQSMALEGSQYGDQRPLSAIATCRYSNNNIDKSHSDSNSNSLIVTGGWAGSIKLWDGSTPALDLLSTKSTAHEDRIMSIAMHKGDGHSSSARSSEQKQVCQLASASIDLTGKLWNVYKNDSNDNNGDNDNNKCTYKYTIDEMAVLKGHAARLCKIAFHPSGLYVGTTSFDHTFRLWDVETGGTEILLQDGHNSEVYGIGFHPDGSLVSTTDYGSVVQCWDLRSGKSACHFMGHAKRVLCTEFAPNGFQLATAGDDGTIKVWDLRQRKMYASIPAHSGLITSIKFSKDDGCYGFGNGGSDSDSGSGASGSSNGEFLTSCSFDGTGKVWSTRNWKLLGTLRGHEGKVMGMDILDGCGKDMNGIVTCGYDKTMKIWK